MDDRRKARTWNETEHVILTRRASPRPRVDERGTAWFAKLVLPATPYQSHGLRLRTPRDRRAGRLML
jgi:hypothetical protein